MTDRSLFDFLLCYSRAISLSTVSFPGMSSIGSDCVAGFRVDPRSVSIKNADNKSRKWAEECEVHMA